MPFFWIPIPLILFTIPSQWHQTVVSLFSTVDSHASQRLFLVADSHLFLYSWMNSVGAFCFLTCWLTCISLYPSDIVTRFHIRTALILPSFPTQKRQQYVFSLSSTVDSTASLYTQMTSLWAPLSYTTDSPVFPYPQKALGCSFFHGWVTCLSLRLSEIRWWFLFLQLLPHLS